jgi:flagellar hook-basal body complex protein FliE
VKLAWERALPRLSYEGPSAVEPALPSLDPTGVSHGPQGGSFAEHLETSLGQLEATTAQADQASEGMVTGHVDIHDAMIAMEKADVMLKLGGTVRNKLLDAYRQLSTMS